MITKIYGNPTDMCLKSNRLKVLQRLIKKAGHPNCQVDAMTETAFCRDTKRLFYMEHSGGDSTHSTIFELHEDS